jgi:dolichyl-phosphate beta-glucosyltransferase
LGRGIPFKTELTQDIFSCPYLFQALYAHRFQLYIALVIWSPPPIITHDSEKKYRSNASPTIPLQLSSLDETSLVDLSIIIPAYNETSRLPAMLAAAIDHLTSPSINNKYTYEILIVDDGSTDNTSATSLKLAAKYPKVDIKVITLEKNLGKGGAVRHGMLYGSGNRLLMVDADGASRFEDLELLWDAMDTLAPDSAPAVVVGSRAHLVKTDAVVKVCHSRLINIPGHGLMYTSTAFSPSQYSYVWVPHHPPGSWYRPCP